MSNEYNPMAQLVDEEWGMASSTHCNRETCDMLIDVNSEQSSIESQIAVLKDVIEKQ